MCRLLILNCMTLILAACASPADPHQALGPPVQPPPLLVAIPETDTTLPPFRHLTINPAAVPVKGFDMTMALQLLDLCMDLSNRDDATDAPGRTGDPRFKADTNAWTPIDPPGRNDEPLSVGRWNNAWRLWRKNGAGNTFAVVIRGTEPNPASIVDDIILTTIPVAPAILQAWPDGSIAFRIANDPKAEAHLGFVFGMAVLMFARDHGILNELKQVVPPGSVIYITGHSQGAAVATLVHAFLHYAMNDTTNRYGLGGMNYMLNSYMFAQPKPGNAQFAADFARIGGTRRTSFVINNTLDWVPQVPLTREALDEPASYIASGLKNHFFSDAIQRFDSVLQGIRRLVSTANDRIIEPELTKWRTGTFALDTAYKTVHLKAPPGGQSLNYVAAGNIIPVFGRALPPAPEPLPRGAVESDRTDALYQHHLFIYKDLLQNQIISSCRKTADTAECNSELTLN
jgi:hypothetical protein